jgi:hypothetical protein
LVCKPSPGEIRGGFDGVRTDQRIFLGVESGNNIGQAVGLVNSALTQVQRVAYGNALNQIDLTQNFLNQVV